MDFAGKCFLIMGATSGIGSVVCAKLAQKGASLYMTGRDKGELDHLKDSLKNPDMHRILQVAIDAESYQEMKDDLSNFLSEKTFEGLNGGVYCPGIYPIIPLRALSWEIIEEIMKINFAGAMMMVQMVARKDFISKEGSSFVFISSVSGIRGQKAYSVYGASKAALVAASRSLALELAPKNIKINCVCCGHLDTSTNIERDRTIPGRREHLNKEHPLGIGTPEDAAEAISFLLSEKSRWITGTELVVDGGFSA